MVEDYYKRACEVRVSGASDFLTPGKAVKIRHGPAHCEQPINLSQRPLLALSQWEGGIDKVASQETCHKPFTLIPSCREKEVKNEKNLFLIFYFSLFFFYLFPNLHHRYCLCLCQKNKRENHYPFAANYHN